MIKYYIILFFAFLLLLFVYEIFPRENFTSHAPENQKINFIPHILDSAWNASSVCAVDMDSDGHIDVLASSRFSDQITWFENDGNKNFTRHFIKNESDGPESLYALDLDKDGDIDFLCASSADDKIAWYENNGNQEFTAHTITTEAEAAQSVNAADIDGDNDIDVLSASAYDDKIAWYKNDGNQEFTAHTVSNMVNGARSVYAADVDSDGDMDILSAAMLDDKITWHENNGSQGFSNNFLHTEAGEISVVTAADIDSDGDMDVLAAEKGRSILFVNDGKQKFDAVFVPGSGSARSIHVADMDSDGDLDIINADSWSENDGNLQFQKQEISTTSTGTGSVSAADFDNDGDLDVVSAFWEDDYLIWYENVGDSVGLTNHVQTPDNGDLLVVNANTVNPGIEIKYRVKETCLITLEIYDILGRRIAVPVKQEMVPGHYCISFDRGGMASNVYLLSLRMGDRTVAEKIFLSN